jgi:Rps23 Pro-64 3,4-dihydroxylase Tpa1-like proline 4-hydroxylase
MRNASQTATEDHRAPVPSVIFDYDRYEARAAELAAKYGSNTPFPHITFDDFLVAEAATQAAHDFPSHADEHWITYRHVNENKASTDRWDEFPPIVEAIIREMNTPRFVELVSKITGIDGLLADPDIEGGGMHQSWTGGFLNVHTDFTMHRARPSWRRRCNLILYMNDGWNPEWGGALQLWDSRMKNRVEKVECVLNRAVLFNTPRALHGFPDPLTCPEDRSRKSIQWYYYTAEDASEVVPVSTTYYARPDESAMKHVMVRLDNFALRAYAWAKRNLGLSDAVISRVMSLFPARKGH